MGKRLAFVDLFAGCGGLSLGMVQARFTPVFANEICDCAAETYQCNSGMDEKQVLVGNVYF